MKTLLILEQVGDVPFFFVTEEDIPSPTIDILIRNQGKIIGAMGEHEMTDDDQDFVGQLQTSLCNNDQDFGFKKITSKELMTCKPDVILHTGIIL